MGYIVWMHLLKLIELKSMIVHLPEFNLIFKKTALKKKKDLLCSFELTAKFMAWLMLNSKTVD